MVLKFESIRSRLFGVDITSHFLGPIWGFIVVFFFIYIGSLVLPFINLLYQVVKLGYRLMKNMFIAGSAIITHLSNNMVHVHDRRPRDHQMQALLRRRML
jgi:hypothetical protein